MKITPVNFFSTYIINPMSKDLSFSQKILTVSFSILLFPISLSLLIYRNVYLKNKKIVDIIVQVNSSANINRPNLISTARKTHNQTSQEIKSDTKKGEFVDPFNLLAGQGKLDPEKFAWLLNLGLLNDLDKIVGNDENTKTQIRFLAANYLTKSAPIHSETWVDHFKNPKVQKMFETLFQTSPFKEWWYHREGAKTNSESERKIAEKLFLGTNSTFILTDSINFSSLVPLMFTPLDPNLPSASTKNLMKEVLNEHFRKNPSNPLDTHLKLPFYIDLTTRLGNINVSENDKLDSELTVKFDVFKRDFQKVIGEIVDELIKTNPDIKKVWNIKSKLTTFIDKNSLCVSCTEIDNVQGIKILPVHSENEQLKDHFFEFIKLTGLTISALNLRRYLLNPYRIRDDIIYTPEQKAPIKAFYPKKSDFINSAFFQRISSASKVAQDSVNKQNSASENSSTIVKELAYQLSLNPSVLLMVKSTTDLLEGLFKEIDDNKWGEINQHPVWGRVLQERLFLIRERLAAAEQLAYQDHSFALLAQSIELVHAEIASLLEITRPFKDGDFDSIYEAIHLKFRGQENLRNLLRPYFLQG